MRIHFIIFSKNSVGKILLLKSRRRNYSIFLWKTFLMWKNMIKGIFKWLDTKIAG